MGATLPAAGTVLASKYKIVRVLGRGGMGIVYEAWHQRLHQRIAIKMLLPEIAQDPDLVARFETEARAAARLESPRVVKVLDVDTSPEGVPYIVMEFLEGVDLESELHRRRTFPIPEAVALIMEACVPIAEAHAKGIVHRDLKPSNLFLQQKDGERRLKLLDFGISKVTVGHDIKQTSSFQQLGTPQYMSPEQVRHSRSIDGRTDVWSLGIILYELLTGNVPYVDENPSAIIAAIAADPISPPGLLRPDIPKELEDVIMKALEKNPQNRYPDVRAFASALAKFAPEEELEAFPAAEAFSGRRSIPDGFEAMSRDAPTLPPPSSTPVKKTTPLGPISSSTPMRTTPAHTMPLVPDPRDSGHSSGSWTGRPPPSSSRWRPILVGGLVVAAAVGITIYAMNRNAKTEVVSSAPHPTVTVTVIVPASTTVTIATATSTAPAITSAPVRTLAPATSTTIARPKPSAAPSASVEDNPLSL